MIPQRVYVKIVAEFSAEGNVTPTRLEFNDQWFDIDRLVSIDRRGPESGGGGMLRYTVKIWGQVRYLWRDGDRWFVEVRG